MRAKKSETNFYHLQLSFYTHSVSEPFGITTVQGIATGCIPIVHNSGGQIEIVEDELLRYNNEAEIPEKIKHFKVKIYLR
jgi:glycosyltransferase involved in cell wall biosynthesis